MKLSEVHLSKGIHTFTLNPTSNSTEKINIEDTAALRHNMKIALVQYSAMVKQRLLFWFLLGKDADTAEEYLELTGKYILKNDF